MVGRAKGMVLLTFICNRRYSIPFSGVLVGITMESGETGNCVHYFISHYFIKTLHNFTEKTPIQINIYNIIIYGEF